MRVRASPGVRARVSRSLQAGTAVRPALGVLLLWAAIPVFWVALEALRHGGIPSGTDGALAGADQLYYMDSIRQSGEHVLIGDNFAIALGQPVYLNPLYLLGGALWRLGIPIQVCLWLLQGLGAVALALGAARLAAAVLPGARARLAALGLGLFYLSPLVALPALSHAIGPLTRFELNFPAGESMPAWQLWGYPHSPISVAALAYVLCGLASLTRSAPSSGARGSGGSPGARSEPPRARLALMCGASALLAWLHPWQGATLILVLGALALDRRAAVPLRALVASAVSAALPLGYEAILSRSDAAWRLDARQNAVGHVPLWMLLVALGPLVVGAVGGVRSVGVQPWRTILVAWPAAAVAVYLATNQFPYHALEGASLPLAVLAVAGWRGACRRLSAPRRRAALGVGLAAILLGAGCGVAYEAVTFRDSLASGAAPYRLADGERRALAYLDRSPVAGGVLARYYLGMAVPAFTGRHTWVGEFTWTPDFARRVALADRLMSGAMNPAPARALVLGSGVRFLLADCQVRVPLTRLLGSAVGSVRHFGCATVYRVAAPQAPGRAHPAPIGAG